LGTLFLHRYILSAKGILPVIDRLDDTIVAISSAAGFGALGIVRLSGPQALSIADGMIEPVDGQPLASFAGFTQHLTRLRIDADGHLPVRIMLFRAPLSYTRQDLVEFHTIGAPAVLEVVRQCVLARGAIAAMPGEFTARAFLHGAMDLASAEAVAGMIQAQTDTQLRASRRLMDGTLQQRVRSCRDELAELLALVEADIDFAEEPIDFITPEELRRKLTGIDQSLHELCAEPMSLARVQVVPHILLVGPPNAGKSTLMNRLTGTNRAICAAAAGTTRDILSAPVRIGRGEAILLDSAGIDDVADEILLQAQTMTLLEAQRADLCCFVVDAESGVSPGVISALTSKGIGRTVVILNKCDLLDHGQIQRMREAAEMYQLGPVCPVSAKTGEGIDTLRSALQEALGRQMGSATGELVLLNDRQRTAIRETSAAIQRAVVLVAGVTATIDCADVLAFELREALDALAAVTGEITTEDLLTQVFANFCIGK